MADNPEVQLLQKLNDLNLSDAEQETLQKLIQKHTPREKPPRNRLALLITNVDFAKRTKKRHGAEKDEENMLMLLEEFDYDVQKYTNLTAQEIDSAVMEFSQDPRLVGTDSVFVVLMSHGEMGVIFGKNWPKDKEDRFPIDNIYTHLDAQNCKALRNTPKVVIIQACRKEKSEAAHDGDEDEDDTSGYEEDAVAYHYQSSCLVVVQNWVHREKDFVSLLSCTPDAKSYRDIAEGSYLIQYIVEIFKTFAHEDDIEELFRKVQNRFEKSERNLPMPTKERCTLTKPFYLFPVEADGKKRAGSDMSSTLIPCTEAFLKENLNNKGIYPVHEKSSRNRLALLITNVEFVHTLKRRNGADKDEEDMSVLLSALGYEVEKHRDLSAKEIDSALEKLSQSPRLGNVDSVFVVVMSHGQEGVIFGSDGKEFPIGRINTHLNKENCPALWNKPKVIIIQACRGGLDGAVPDGGDSGASEDDDDDDDGENNGTDGEKPKEKDFITLLSTTPHTLSYRHVVDGSFLIQSIVGVFNTFAHEDHIEELFRKVMNHVGESLSMRAGGRRTQMPCKDRCTLTKPFYLFPGY